MFVANSARIDVNPIATIFTVFLTLGDVAMLLKNHIATNNATNKNQCIIVILLGLSNANIRH